MNTRLLICIRREKKKEREGEGRRKRRLHSHSVPDFMTPRGACSISNRKFQLSPVLSPSQSYSPPAGYQLLPELYQPRPKSSIEPKPFCQPLAFPSLSSRLTHPHWHWPFVQGTGPVLQRRMAGDAGVLASSKRWPQRLSDNDFSVLAAFANFKRKLKWLRKPAVRTTHLWFCSSSAIP